MAERKPVVLVGGQLQELPDGDTLPPQALAAHSHANATPSAAGFMSAADKTKLNGIATGATANSTDAQLRARSSHTGAQAISTVTNLQTSLDAKQATLVSGTNIKTVGGQSLLGSGDVPTTGEPKPTATTISRTGGVITSMTETVGGTPRVTTITRSGGVVTQIAVAHNGTTRTETLTRTNGQVTGITVTET